MQAAASMTEVTPSDIWRSSIADLLLRPRHIRVSRPALLRETLLSNMAVANVDTRFRTIEGRCSAMCLSVCLSAGLADWLADRLSSISTLPSHIPSMLWQPRIAGSIRCTHLSICMLLIRSVIKVSHRLPLTSV